MYVLKIGNHCFLMASATKAAAVVTALSDATQTKLDYRGGDVYRELDLEHDSEDSRYYHAEISMKSIKDSQIQRLEKRKLIPKSHRLPAKSTLTKELKGGR